MASRTVNPPTQREGEAPRLFEAAFALSFVPVSIIDDERQFQAVSQAASDVFGRHREELLGRRIDECLQPESRARLAAIWPGCVRSKACPHEVVILRADGLPRRVPISVKANVLPGLHLLTLDVESDHGRAEEDFLEALIAGSPGLLVVAMSNGYPTRVNPACGHTLGWSEEELLARPFLDLVHREDRLATLDALERLRSGASTSSVTLRLRCRDGTYRTIKWNAFSIPGHRAIAAVGRVVPAPAGVAATEPSWAWEDPRDLVPGQEDAKGQGWLGDEAYRGLEPSLTWAFEHQLRTLDRLTRLSPEPRVAAIRCALALRQTLAEMGTILGSLPGPPILAGPAGGAPEPQPPRGRAPAPHAPIAAKLTERERDVLRLVALGHDNRMISGELFLADVTVRKHVQNIMAKFEVTSRTQAAITAVRLGLDR